jgi:hypothetical protein
MEGEIRTNMIESVVKVCLANSVHSRRLLDADDSRDHRMHSESAPMEARFHLLYPQVLDESARERRTDQERLRDDQLRILLPEISPLTVSIRL